VQDDATMNIPDIDALAKRYFVSADGLSTAQLIRKIQIAQGNPDCYACGKRSCEQTQGPWRDDCLGQSAPDSQFQTTK